MEIEKLIEALGDLEMCSYGYRINGEVLGMDCTDFECLMVDAAEEISKIPALQAENDRLQAELEKEEAARKKQADILYELRGQKYEQTTAIDQLRAENDRLKRERDAAVESIPHECKTCLYHTVSFNGCTPDHDCTNLDGGCSNNYDRWVWRGPKEDRHGTVDT